MAPRVTKGRLILLLAAAAATLRVGLDAMGRAPDPVVWTLDALLLALLGAAAALFLRRPDPALDAPDLVRRAEALLELGEEGSWEWELATGRLRWGPRWTEVLGYEAAELPRDVESWAVLVHPDDLREAQERFAESRAKPSIPFQMELRMRRKDGAYRWLASRGRFLTSETGEVVRFVAAMREVTPRKRMEAELLEANARLTERARTLDAILRDSPDMIAVADLEGRCLYASGSIARFLGMRAEDVVGRTAPEVGHADFPFAEHARHAVATGALQRYESSITLPTGARFFEYAVSPVMEGGSPKAVLIIARDVTERRAERDALARSEAHYRLLAENMTDLVMLADDAGRITYASPSSLALLGIPADELVGVVFADLLPPDERETFVAAWDRLRRERTRAALAVQMQGRDGAGVWMEVVARSLAMDDVPRDGPPRQAAILVARDISARKAAEDEARHLNATLEQKVARRTRELEGVNRELESFAYSVSHDLRAPLRAIDGFSRLVIEDHYDRLDPSGRDALERVRAATQRMGALIDDLLQLSRVSRAPLRFERVDVTECAQAIARELQLRDRARKVEFSIEPGLNVVASKELIESVMRNLLENAWKFTSRHPTAHIEVGARATPDGQTIYVRDDGAGFDPRFADKLFGAFQRLHLPADFPGNGIGLATVKRILQRHGGDVWAEGALEKGATFYFRLPAREESLPPEDAAPAADPQGPQEGPARV